MSGVNPPGTGGTPMRYDQENSAPDPPACHVYDNPNGVLEKSPLSDDGPDATSTTNGPTPPPPPGSAANFAHNRASGEDTTAGSAGTDTKPDTVDVFALLADCSGS